MRRYGVGVSNEVLRRLVREIVSARAPERAARLNELSQRPLDRAEREALREVLADDLVEAGLSADGEPNERGRLIEAAIDWLGHQ